MELKKEENKSSCKSHIWKNKQPEWQIVRDLWESPLYIRNKTTAYLDKGNAEPQGKYDQRLNRSVINNFFRDTIERFGGMVFKSDPVPDNISLDVKNLFTDIDLCGNSLHSFLITSFEKYLRDGNGFFLVDSPPLNEVQRKKIAEGDSLTLAERANDRPFWVYYEASQLINHAFEKVNGRNVLSRATLESSSYETVGDFGEKEVIFHLILKRGSYEVRKFEKKDDIEKDIYTQEVAETSTGLSEIPLVPITEIGTTPPFLTMAMLNIQHYGQTSEFDDVIRIADNPRWVVKLNTKEEAIAWLDLMKKRDVNSSAVGTVIYGEHAEAGYKEITGAGLEVAKARFEDVASEIAKKGAGMLAPTELAPRTATEVADTAGQRQSRLAKFTRDFENAIEKTLYFTAEIYNQIKGSQVIKLTEAEGAEIKLNIDYDRLTVSPEKLAILQTEIDAHRLSHLTYLEMLSRTVELPTTPEEEVARLDAEKGTKSDVENVILFNGMTIAEMNARLDLVNKGDGFFSEADARKILFPKNKTTQF